MLINIDLGDPDGLYHKGLVVKAENFAAGLNALEATIKANSEATKGTYGGGVASET